ncbi:MAG TPA: preprotein translocase subunit SecD, partial [Methanotrichaceae archaeon]|nr:preprotein translocase subunit SecD [Methanotrichaceae archaeon]
MKITNNPRVLLYIVAVAIALILIAPLPSEQGLQSRLKFGLDLEGGSWLQLQLQGAVVQLNVDPAKILEKQFQATSVEKNGDNYLVTVNGQTPANLAENLGYPGAKAVTRNNVTRINIPISGQTVITNYLKSILDADVKIVGVDPIKYEIRTNVTRESLNAALADVGGSVATGENTFVDGVTPDTVDETKKVLDQKLNRLGMQDIKVRVVGNQFILIDLAGMDVSTAQDIVGKPGKFEIRIQTQNNETEHVLYGDAIESVDIPRADRGSMAGVPFTLSEDGASILQKAAIDVGATKNPKAHELSMYLDKDQIFSAPLAPELASSIAKAPMRNLVAEVGSGDAGILKAKELYIHLKEGALPVNVKVIGSGQVTAALGSQFKTQIVIAGILALLAVAGMIYWRYRVRRIVFPLVFTSVSEVIMILGIWAGLGWQLDLAGIAGIITVIGTGVDQLVIITDRLISGATSLPGKSEGKYAVSGSKLHAQRIMEILGIIMGAAATTVAGMLPLLRMGFGSLTAFALTVIIGVFIGVGIARPAYASIADYILADEGEVDESRPMTRSAPKSGLGESVV